MRLAQSASHVYSCLLQGWDWIDEGRTKRQHKKGFISTNPGDYIDLEVGDFLSPARVSPKDLTLRWGKLMGRPLQACAAILGIWLALFNYAFLSQRIGRLWLGSHYISCNRSVSHLYTFIVQVPLYYVPKLSSKYLVAIGGLISYQHMGTMELKCIGGCSCPLIRFNMFHAQVQYFFHVKACILIAASTVHEIETLDMNGRIKQHLLHSQIITLPSW